MLKTLVKKQLFEVFRSYFYDAKKNTARSKAGTVLWFIFFALLMVGMLGGIFTALSLSICPGLYSAGIGWFFFTLMGGISIVLGAFGSVFNTYSGLYLSKDNELLLSMPIPEKTIIASRLVNVYLLGAMYSAVVFLPAMIVYMVTARCSASVIGCCILMFLIITLIVLVLSCLLGWVVAKISLKVKNKSFISVLAALVFLGLYWFCYTRATVLISELVANAAVYGAEIKGSAHFLYLFGRMGEGDWTAVLIYAAIMAAVSFLTWKLLEKTFLSVATASGKSKKVRYVEKRVEEKSVFRAFLGKEFGRFTSSPDYMLNCGLGILFVFALGVVLLIKGGYVAEILADVFSSRPGSTAILFMTALLMAASMIDTAAPSVSLEGKSLWIPQSLPVMPRTVLISKCTVQMLLSGIPMLFASVCAAVIIPESLGVRVMMVVLSLVFALFNSIFNLYLGIKMPSLTWTSELVPIKQSGAVAIAIFGGWAIVLIFAAVYMFFGFSIGALHYMIIVTFLFVLAGLLLLRYLLIKGAARFSAL